MDIQFRLNDNNRGTFFHWTRRKADCRTRFRDKRQSSGRLSYRCTSRTGRARHCRKTVRWNGKVCTWKRAQSNSNLSLHSCEIS